MGDSIWEKKGHISSVKQKFFIILKGHTESRGKNKNKHSEIY